MLFFFSAIPVFINSSRLLKFEESDLVFDPQLSYILSKDVDLGLEGFELDTLLLSFVNVSYSFITPSLAIMGGLYPNTQSNSFFGIINTFYTEVWLEKMCVQI